MKEVNEENFAAILREYLPEQTFTMQYHNETKQEFNIIVNLLTRSAIMQLIGECDRQGFDCYITGTKGKSMFVVLTNNYTPQWKEKQL